MFHVRECKWAKKINPKYINEYSSPADAFAEGLRPSKICENLMLGLKQDSRKSSPGERGETLRYEETLAPNPD